MKKTSIFLTAALIVVAILAGCSDSVAITGLPQSVKSGKIIQTGDFLDGQAFDPQKFSVEITYDNGTIAPADSAVSVRLVDQDGIAEAGDRLEALIGYDVYGDPVYAEGSLSAYMIKSVSVAGPSSYVNKAVPKASDLTVTATYLDSKNAEKTMVLGSDEFKVTGVVYANNNIGPNASQTSVDAVATVEPGVGQTDGTTAAKVTGEFAFTATFEAAQLGGVIENIARVSIKNGTVIPAWGYETMPVPSFNDLVVMVKYVGKDGFEQLSADPGVELTYVNADKTPLTTTDFSTLTSSDISVQLVYNDFVVYSTAGGSGDLAFVKPTEVTLSAGPVFGFEKIVEESELELVPADFVVTATCGALPVQNIPSDAVEFGYYTCASGEGEEDRVPATTAPTVASGDELWLKVSYQGVHGWKEMTSYIEAKGEAVPEEILVDTVKFADGYTLPSRVYYKTLPSVGTTVSDIIKSFDVAMSDGTTKTVDVTAASGAVKLESDYYFSADDEDIVDGDNAATVTVDSATYYDVTAEELYLKLTYTEKEESVELFVPVDTVVPAIAAITVEAKPQRVFDEDGDGVIGDDETQPMVGSEIDYTMSTFDADKNGNVISANTAIDFAAYTVQADGVAVTSESRLPAATAEKQAVVVYANIIQDDGTMKLVQGSETINAGKGYIDPSSLRFDYEKSTIPFMPIDSTVKDIISNFDTTSKSFVLTGYTPVLGNNGTKAETAEDLAPSLAQGYPDTQKIVEGENSLDIIVKYLAEDGFWKNEVVALEFEGGAYTTVVSGKDPLLIDGKGYADNNALPEGTYSISVSNLNPECFVQHGDDENLAVSITVNGEPITTNTFEVADGDKVVVSVTYTDKTTGKVVTTPTKISLTGEAVTEQP